MFFVIPLRRNSTGVCTAPPQTKTCSARISNGRPCSLASTVHPLPERRNRYARVSASRRAPARRARGTKVRVIDWRVPCGHPSGPVDPSNLGAALAAFAEAGADEVILVCDPITEGSIRSLGAALG